MFLGEGFRCLFKQGTRVSDVNGFSLFTIFSFLFFHFFVPFTCIQLHAIVDSIRGLVKLRPNKQVPQGNNDASRLIY